MYFLKTSKRVLITVLISLITSVLWQACSRKPQSVQELFPKLVIDETAQAKQFAVVATGADPMIDDLEDGDLNGLKLEGRNWNWSQFDDLSDGIQYLTIVQEEEAPGTGNSVLYVKGGDWKIKGAGLHANLIYKSSPRSYGFYDASVYSGIQFWVKTYDLDQLKVSIGIPATTSVDDGGSCFSKLPGHFDKLVPVSNNWAHIQIPFEAFILEEGKHSLPLDPSQIKGIHFSFETLKDYEVWMDELSFIKR